MTGDEVDAEPSVVVEPSDFARALNAEPVTHVAYDRLAYGDKREHVLAIDNAKKPGCASGGSMRA